MFYLVFATVDVAILVISFLAFAFPDRYVRIANLYFAKSRSERRLQLRMHRRWSYRISNLALFLMILGCSCRYLWMVILR